MKIASIADVKKHLSAYLRDENASPIVVTRNGRPAGVLLVIDDDEEIERLIFAYSPRLQTILDASREEIQRTGGAMHEVFWAGVEATEN